MESREHVILTGERVIEGMQPISKLQFGFIDAKTYMERPTDAAADFFKRSFHASTHLDRTVDPHVFFLIGEKGTGKTAYSVYASHFLPGYAANIVLFETTDFARFIEVANRLNLTSTQYSVLWSFVFSLVFLSHLANRLDCPDSCLLYTSPSPRDLSTSRMPSSA